MDENNTLCGHGEITLVPISSASDLKKGVEFRLALYEGNPYFVPPLTFDEVHTLDPQYNAAFEVCDAQSFLAYRGGKIVGRATAIIHKKANEIWKRKVVRFGFTDFIDDLDVSRALFHAIEEWGKERGMEEIEGPLGFTDWDPEGMLVEGFDLIHTSSTSYNYPYYPSHLEQLGFEKSIAWREFQVIIPKELPERFVRMADLVTKRYHLRNLRFKTIQEAIKKGYIKKIFYLLNRCYEPIYGFAPLTERQIDDFIKYYARLVSPKFISLIVDEEDNAVAVGLSMPSLASALQKAHGKLFPFGWFYLLKALYFDRKVVEMLLMGVDPKYQSRGVNILLFKYMGEQYFKMGLEYAETNLELEDNQKMVSQWNYFTHKQVRRRFLFKKKI